MNLDTNPGPAANNRLPIGELLVHTDLLTRADLDLALIEQKETGKPLGRILVERGFVSIPVMANALAEQYGGLLKTEYGFATGLTPKSPPAEASVDLPPVQTDSFGKKPWGADEFLREPSRKALSVEDLSQPFVQPAAVPAPAPVPVPAPVEEAVVEAAPEPEPAEDITGLLAALNEDDIDQVEAALKALREAMAASALRAS